MNWLDGATCDAFHETAPEDTGDGAARAMSLAIQSAGARAEDVDYINAHGTSTKLNDACETRAVKSVLGEHARRVMLSSTKSMTGHLLGAPVEWRPQFVPWLSSTRLCRRLSTTPRLIRNVIWITCPNTAARSFRPEARAEQFTWIRRA